jgi:ABC-type dipeptide/oligopeptide/nickel transport system permease component
MKIISYIIKRLLSTIPTLFGLLVLIFSLSRIIPTSPVAVIAGEFSTPAQIKELEKRYGFDQPLHVQFFSYLKKLYSLDLGVSLRSNRPVITELKRRLPPTIELAITATGLAIILGIPLGIISALKRNSWIDHFLRGFTVAGVAFASFWLGIMLQLLFSLYFRILPLGGQMTGTLPPNVTGFMLIDSVLACDPRLILDAVYHLILPAVTLCMPGLSSFARFTRSGFIGVMQSDYIVYNQSMGMPKTKIICKYAFKNAIVATVTQIGLIFGLLIANTVIVEYIFFWPGLGSYMVDVMLFFDYEGILGTTLFIGLSFLIINLITDVIQAYLDPRVLENL